MPNPNNPTASLWLETCPDLLLGLVDALKICNMKVPHPLVLRTAQRPVSCKPGCNNNRNLKTLASDLVQIVTQNQHYSNILRWFCPACSSSNIGTNICTSCPTDPFKNSPLFNILGKVFESFFKSLVTLTASNPPINVTPEKVTKFRLIETVLTSHGLKWHRLVPLDFSLSYRCSCIKTPTSTPTEDTADHNTPQLDQDDDDLLLLDLSSESLYEVGLK